MDFSGDTSNQSARKEEIIEQIKYQLAVAQTQEFLDRMADKCFKKCITRPGVSLDSSEQKCLAMCMDRFLDSYNLVSKTYLQRLQKETEKMY